MVGALDGVGGMPLAVIAAEEQHQKQEDVFRPPSKIHVASRKGRSYFEEKYQCFPNSVTRYVFF
jgi:hypothetical protein